MYDTTLDYQQLSADYRLVEKAIRYLEQNYQRQPELVEVAASVGLSEYHFQRLFSRWAGISPKRFLQYLTKEHAKSLLDKSRSLLEVTLETGLSSPSRLHDLFVTCEAVTPGQYKSHGAGLSIRYGFFLSPFGETLLASTERGICYLSFVGEGGHAATLEELQDRWKNASLIEDPFNSQVLAKKVFQPFHEQGRPALQLHLVGSNFQIKVWEALLRIPLGSVVAYQDVAGAIDMPEASRAVGTAIAKNPIPVIIPCHRVIRKDGDFGGYHYGLERKKALLGWEASHLAEAG